MTDTLDKKINKQGKETDRGLSVRGLVPNAITVLALCAGLSSIRLGLAERFEMAFGMIFLASLLDGIDGRIARLLKAESRIGAQLDSLVDFLNFGIAPVLLIYIWGAGGMGRIGWLAILVFSVCAALRLARFNVLHEDPDRPVWADNFFVGMPSPAAGLLSLMPMVIHFAEIADMKQHLPAIAIYIVLLGAMMVSRIPTYSGKQVTLFIPRHFALPILLGTGILAGGIFTFPWVGLIFLAAMYLLSIPVSSWRYHHFRNGGYRS